MSQICIIENSLDIAEQKIIESKNVFKTFLGIRTNFPQARIYKDNPCGETDVTPSIDNKESIARLLESNEDFTIVCHPGDVSSIATWAFTKIVGAAINSLIKMPKMNNDGLSGSSNNNLANAENKQRIKQRVPYILGKVKAVPDLFSPAYRYFQNGIEVEELLLCVCENPVRLSDFREGDTSIKEMEGKSLTAYGLNQNITGTQNIYQFGDIFDQAPLIVKQSPAVNGQTLLNPNSTYVEKGGVYFVYPNQIRFDSATSEIGMFDTGESIIVDWADYVINDLSITGQVSIDASISTITIASTNYSPNALQYRKINITAMLAMDAENGQLDLAGAYNISSITYANSAYTIILNDPESVNADMGKVTAPITTNISATLTDNIQSISLNGTYSVASVSEVDRVIYLVSPSTVNADWNDLTSLGGNRTPSKYIQLRGSQFNYIGWFTLDTPTSEGILLNFRAPSGINQGEWARHVDIEVQYQQVMNGVPTGSIYTLSNRIWGKNKSRDSVGLTVRAELPFTGAFRFRARRANDNGTAADLIDEMKFYQAYSYHKLKELNYDNRVLIRTRTVATANATSQDSRQLNCIAESLVYSYRSGARSANRIASRNIADLAIDIALHPKIGRRSISELNLADLYQVIDEIQDYFGSEKMAEFNYTLDNDNTSFEEIIRMMAAATCTHDRRINRNIFFELESAENEPLILFNHRNKKRESEVRKYSFRPENNYDGIELTYIDSVNGWIEKTLKIPNEFLNNPKKVDATGVVYTQQAHIIAWREWNKIQFNRIATTFTAYCESDLVARGDTVLCTDDTRIGNNESDGEIAEWSGTTIRGSQPFSVGSDHVIHLQLKSGQIDVIPISQGESPYHFVLGRVPMESLITTGEVKTAYSITTDANRASQKFLIAKKDPIDIFENKITAINWDARYYRNDKDIISNLI